MMLQLNKSPSTAPHEAEPASPAVMVRSAISFARRQYLVILPALLLTGSIATVYLVTAPPVYTARAKLIIDTRKMQLFQQQSILGDIGMDSAAVESQVEILKSKNIALQVIKEQHLTENPEFVGPGGGFVGALTALIIGKSNPDTSSEAELTQLTLNVFAGRLEVKRVGLTYVIEIGFRALNPAGAAHLANHVAKAYILDQLNSKFQATKLASSWLQDRVAELRDQSSISERAVVDFKEKNNIISADGKLMNEQQLAELNTQIIVARAKTSEAQARLNQIEAVLRSDKALTADGATVTDTLNNSIVTKLRGQYLDYVNRDAEWTARFGPNHLAVVNLRNQMRVILNSIREELRRLAETYKSDYEIAKQREQNIERELAAVVSQSQLTNQVKIKLRELESTAQIYRTIYDSFLQRYMESIQQQSFSVTEARLISEAAPPAFRSEPQARLVFTFALLGGLALGCGLGWLREMSDRVFRTRRQVETVLERDCVAVLPLVETAAADNLPSLVEPGLDNARIIARKKGVAWSTVDAPFSRFTEEVRSIKLAVDLNGTGKGNKVVGVTSSMPNEGKSTVAQALARLAAQTGSRVILADCDLRNPTLTQTLTPKASIGILDVITGKAPLEDAVWKDGATGMMFLPATMKARLVHSNEVLSADATKSLFEKLRQTFDYIIVDLSPLMPVVDVRASTELINSYLFVIEWGRTKTDVVERTLTSAKVVYENLLGVVLNKVDMRAIGRFEGYEGRYYYDKHYARCGYTE
jgi:succinoglycan biosynthesis transport protein ExoP